MGLAMALHVPWMWHPPAQAFGEAAPRLHHSSRHGWSLAAGALETPGSRAPRVSATASTDTATLAATATIFAVGVSSRRRRRVAVAMAGKRRMKDGDAAKLMAQAAQKNAMRRHAKSMKKKKKKGRVSRYDDDDEEEEEEEEVAPKKMTYTDLKSNKFRTHKIDPNSAAGRALEEEQQTRMERSWTPGDPVKVTFEDVTWTPSVRGVGDAGRTEPKPVLKNVSWSVSGSERVGLIGANGSGKSSQLLMINDVLECTTGRVTKLPQNMKIGYLKQEADLDDSCTVWETLISVFGIRSLGDIDADLEDNAANCGSPDELDNLIDERTQADACMQEVEDLLARLGMTHFTNTSISELSGGWRMRAGLGKIILSKPDLILLDEPTNHVDLETVEFMEDFLRSQKVAMVIVSHDRYFLNQVCTNIVEIYKGNTTEYAGNYCDFLQTRDQQFNREWRTWNIWTDRVKILKQQIAKHDERLQKERADQKRVQLDFLEANEPPKPQVSELCNFSFPSTFAPDEGGIRPQRETEVKMAGWQTIEAEGELGSRSEEPGFDGEIDPDEPDWSKDFDPDDDDFWGSDDDDDDDADERDQDPIGLGSSAGGSSSTSSAGGRVIDAEVIPSQEEPAVLLEVDRLGVRYPDQVVIENISFSLRRGEKVALVGRNGCGKSTLVKAIVGDLGEGGVISGNFTCSDKQVAYFPQRLAEAFNLEDEKVKDVLYMSCGVEDLERAGGIDEVLRSLQLDGVTQDQQVSSLSGGEKARVAFAQFLLEPWSLLVLDEPTNHLDIPTRELLEDALKKFDGGALVVSHDRFFLREFATRVIEITEDGRIRDFDSWDSYAEAAPPQWAAATEAEIDFIKQDGRTKAVWDKKKMARLRAKVDIGLRRLSPRADEFKPEVRSQQSRKVGKLLEDGVDPALLREHIAEGS